MTPPHAGSGDSSQELDRRLQEVPLLGDGLPRLREGPVLIAGVGTIGSRVARCLATLGVPLHLVDPDSVEAVNVGLQLFEAADVDRPKVEALRDHLLSLRPDLHVSCTARDIRTVGPRTIGRCRLMVGGLDNFQARLWLCETSAHLGIPFLDLAIDGTGRSLSGRASGFDPAHGTACLACSWDGSGWAEAEAEAGSAGCAVLAGTQPASPRTIALPGLGETIAGLGALQVVRLLLGWEADRVLGHEWRLDLSTGRLGVFTLRQNPRCLLSHRLWRTCLLNARPEDVTLGQLLARASDELGGAAALAAHGNPLVLGAGCPACGNACRLLSLRRSLPACPRCGGMLVPFIQEMRDRFGKSDLDGHLDSTWRDVGLPPGGAVRATSVAGDELVFLFEE